jgi:hypothetical protein
MSKKELIDAILELNLNLEHKSLEGKSELELGAILAEEEAKRFRPR